jgi:5-methylcytosine-specific restriction endonuclease McrA
LSESQNHHCAFCGETLIPYSVDQKETCTVKINRAEPRSYDNCVIVCRVCAGRSSSSNMSLLDFYHSGEWKNAIPLKTNSVEYPDTIQEIRRIVTELAPQYGINPDDIPIGGGFRYAPTDRATVIATNLVHKEHIREKKVAIRASSPGKPYKRCFLESQNHRCCYCGETMNTFFTRHPLFATWEHVKALRDNGNNMLANYAIACRTCNSLRDQLDLSADDYYEWVLNNREQLASIVLSELKRAAVFHSKHPKHHVSLLYRSDLYMVLEQHREARIVKYDNGTYLIER